MSMYSLGSVKFDTAAMDRLLRNPAGPTGIHLRGLGERILVMAKRLCGSETGRLSRSMQMQQFRSAGGQSVRVFSNSKYAYMVHEGTRPHIIDPPGNRVLVFNSGGKRVYTQRVRHPGTRGKRYLTIPLRQVVR